MALDYLYAKPSGNVTFSANNPVTFATHIITQPAGTALGLSSGRVTGLKANTNYFIMCGLSASNPSGNANGLYCRLWNSTAGAAFGPGLLDTGQVTSPVYVGNVYPYQAVTFRPGVTTTIELRMISTAGTSAHVVHSDTWIMVVELPSDSAVITAYASADHAFSAGNPVQIDSTYTSNGFAALNAYGVDLTAGHEYLIFATPKAIPTVNTQNINLTFNLYDRTGAANLAGSTTVVVNDGAGRTTNGQLHVPLISVFKPTVNSTVELRMTAVSSGTWNMKATDTTLTVIDLGVPQAGSLRDFWIGVPTAVSSSGLPAISAAGVRSDGKLFGSSGNLVDLKPASLYLALCRPSSSFGAGTDIYTYAWRDNTTTVGNTARAMNEGANSGQASFPIAAALLDTAALGVAAPDTYDNLRMKYLSQSGNPDTLTASSNIVLVELYGAVQREPYVYNLSPATGASIASADPISFKIERPFDDFYSTTIVVSSIWVKYTAVTEAETVYSEGAFQGKFAASSTITPTTLGNSYSLTRTGGWRDDFTIYFEVYEVDWQNDRVLNALVATASYVAPNNPPRDSVVPVVDTFSPATGGTLATLTTAVSFHVTDIGTALIGRQVIWASYATGLKEVVYDGSAFTSHYDAASTVGAIANGYAFSIVREGGWPGNFTLYFEIYDTDGNQAAPASAAWLVSGSIVPTIASFSPALLSTIDQNDTLQFDVTSPNGISLSLEEISVSYAGTSIDEAIYKGGAFCAKYDTSPNAKSNISNGHRFVVRREGGWPGSPTLRFVVTDADGNAGTPTSGAFTLSGAILPVVTLTPVAASAILLTDSILIDVASELNTLSLEEITVSYAGSTVRETVYAGGSWGPRFQASPNAKNSISSAHHAFTVRRDGDWLSSPTFYFVFTDADGNRSSTTTAAYTIAASTYPVVSNVDPESGATLEFQDDVISLDITDVGGLGSTIVLTVYYTGLETAELVYASGQYWGPYDNADALHTAITNGYRFVFNRDDGWLDDFTLYWTVTDADGQVTTSSASYLLQAGPSSDGPYIDNLTPADLSTLARMDYLTFDVLDLNPGIGFVAVWMKYEGDVDWRMIYDNTDFLGVFERESTAETITNGRSFSIQPAGGWVKSFSLRIRAIDSRGNLDVEV